MSFSLVIQNSFGDFEYKYEDDRYYTLAINGVNYEDMDEAPPNERADLARTVITMNMAGPKKTAKFSLLRKGEEISVSVLLNTHTKFSKLAVGKHVVTANLRKNSGE